MGIMKRFKLWRNALLKHFEKNKEEKQRFAMLNELLNVVPIDIREFVQKEGDGDLFVSLALRIYAQLKKKDLLDEFLDEKLAHLEVVEKLVRVVFCSSVQLKLATPSPFLDVNLLQHFPGSLDRRGKKKCVLNTNIIGVMHGALTWKKVKDTYGMSVSSVTCTIEDQLVKLWNKDDTTARKLQSLTSLLSDLTVTSNCLLNYCADFGYPLKPTLRLVSKNGKDDLHLIVDSQTAVFRGQHFYGPSRHGPFLRFESESVMLQVTVVPINKDEESYRWSMCMYQLGEADNWEPDFRCRFAHIE